KWVNREENIMNNLNVKLLNLVSIQKKLSKNLQIDLGISHHNLARWRREYTNKGNLAFPGNGKQKNTMIICR
ncbi:MAG: transposase, partial [Halanaerobiales bacterium]|nr:transposase [Halanaerobiales bacterium]